MGARRHARISAPCVSAAGSDQRNRQPSGSAQLPRTRITARAASLRALVLRVVRAACFGASGSPWTPFSLVGLGACARRVTRSRGGGGAVRRAIHTTRHVPRSTRDAPLAPVRARGTTAGSLHAY